MNNDIHEGNFLAKVDKRDLLIVLGLNSHLAEFWTKKLRRAISIRHFYNGDILWQLQELAQKAKADLDTGNARAVRVLHLKALRLGNGSYETHKRFLQIRFRNGQPAFISATLPLEGLNEITSGLRKSLNFVDLPNFVVA
jgi:hypothetical protein